jgi:hypothetical protein
VPDLVRRCSPRRRSLGRPSSIWEQGRAGGGVAVWPMPAANEGRAGVQWQWQWWREVLLTTPATYFTNSLLHNILTEKHCALQEKRKKQSTQRRERASGPRVRDERKRRESEDDPTPGRPCPPVPHRVVPGRNWIRPSFSDSRSKRAGALC